ncbi:hypothetical protein [Yersinia sp. Marseille-Q3913]|uniref:hypothetical protein n=1 Tax=Yersinia sp. Marseille-Q3913 TaxID=2830769 RepID=UPI001BAFC809|nr:hypothetical protein [Yersinia sp. Marseille-Q3913]MBS0054197.1 hypothetical protein [Yersinia sp. Marseille-Q3913]
MRQLSIGVLLVSMLSFGTMNVMAAPTTEILSSSSVIAPTVKAKKADIPAEKNTLEQKVKKSGKNKAKKRAIQNAEKSVLRSLRK